MRHWVFCLFVLCSPAAFAGDEQAPAPPRLPRDWTPPASPATPSASAPAPAIDEARLAELVDQAVERAIMRRQAATWTPPGGTPQASPQGMAMIPPPTPAARLRIVPAERARSVGTVPAYSESREYVQVMVPAPCHKRALAAVGQRLVEAGQPRVRTMRVAPSALVQEVAVQPARAVYATGQGG